MCLLYSILIYVGEILGDFSGSRELDTIFILKFKGISL
jgi:hypothetical protein